MFAPMSRCFPNYHASMVSPLTLNVAVTVEQLAVQDHVRPAVVSDPLQHLVQIGRLRREDRDALGHVPVRGGLRDADPGTQHVLSSALQNQISTSNAW
ncbi:hypothetical protein AB0H57_29985 [Micromonospora sp. NPDC050686]|uniref:hypothetical protein n=1 Tax=Micromonospora sp. NPDC050686 TaxID=3154631 RepID=UPI0033D56C57